MVKADEKTDDLLQYNKDLINQAITSASSNETLSSQEFYSISTSLLSEAGILDNVSEEDSFHHRNTNIGTQIDGWSWNDLEKTIYGIVTEFNDDPDEIKKINRTQIETLGKRVAKVFESSGKETFIEKIAYDERITLSEINNFIDQTIKFRIIVLTNCSISSRVANTGIKLDKIHDKEASIEVWYLDKLMELEYGGLESSPTVINFEELYGKGLTALAANPDNSSQRSYLCVLPGQYLSDLYHEFGQRLLQSNVRSFLEFRGLSNKGMRETLLREPENFFTYNNGITVTASKCETKTAGKELVITELKNMQIVNGGQTTAVIYFAPKEKGSIRGTELKWSDIDLSRVSVQMKLTILDDEEVAADMTANISQYSNTQAAVTKADLISNHPLHLRIEKMSRKTTVSGSHGLPNKWFYERSRGQYTVQLRQKRTPARKRAFEGEYPKKQKFVKTDMAKYENTWRMHPHQVSEGAQKNLTTLGEKLTKEWDKNEDAFRETFFQDLIAKAILFKTLDTEINKSQWYKEDKGFKAQTVTYSIALLRHLVHQQNKEINLSRIFSNQALSEELLSEALKLSNFVRNKLMDREFRGWGGGGNISQFAKKQIAWFKVRDLDYTLQIPDSDLFNAQQIQDQTYKATELGKDGAELESLETILMITIKEWLELSDYLQKEEGLPYNHKNVKLIRNCIEYHKGRKNPSKNQAKTALMIREKAISKNFTYFE